MLHVSYISINLGGKELLTGKALIWTQTVWLQNLHPGPLNSPTSQAHSRFLISVCRTDYTEGETGSPAWLGNAAPRRHLRCLRTRHRHREWSSAALRPGFPLWVPACGRRLWKRTTSLARPLDERLCYRVEIDFRRGSFHSHERAIILSEIRNHLDMLKVVFSDSYGF